MTAQALFGLPNKGQAPDRKLPDLIPGFRGGATGNIDTSPAGDFAGDPNAIIEALTQEGLDERGGQGVLQTMLAPVNLLFGEIPEAAGGLAFNNLVLPTLAKLGLADGIAENFTYNGQSAVNLDAEEMFSLSGLASALGVGDQRNRRSFFKSLETGKNIQKAAEGGTFMTLMQNAAGPDGELLIKGTGQTVAEFRKENPNLATTIDVLTNMGINPVDFITGAGGAVGALQARKFFGAQRAMLANSLGTANEASVVKDIVKNIENFSPRSRQIRVDRVIDESRKAALASGKSVDEAEEFATLAGNRVRFGDNTPGESIRDAMNDIFGAVPKEELFQRGIFFNRGAGAQLFTGGGVLDDAARGAGEVLSDRLGDSLLRRTFKGNRGAKGRSIDAARQAVKAVEGEDIKFRIGDPEKVIDDIKGISEGQSESIVRIASNPGIKAAAWDDVNRSLTFGLSDGGSFKVRLENVIDDMNDAAQRLRREDIGKGTLNATVRNIGPNKIVFTAGDGSVSEMGETAIMQLAKVADGKIAAEEMAHVVVAMGRLLPTELRTLNSDYLSVLTEAATKLNVKVDDLIGGKTGGGFFRPVESPVDIGKLVKSDDFKKLTSTEQNAVRFKFEEWFAQEFADFAPGTGGSFDRIIGFFRDMWRSLTGKTTARQDIFSKIEDGSVFRRGNLSTSGRFSGAHEVTGDVVSKPGTFTRLRDATVKAQIKDIDAAKSTPTISTGKTTADVELARETKVQRAKRLKDKREADAAVRASFREGDEARFVPEGEDTRPDFGGTVVDEHASRLGADADEVFGKYGDEGHVFHNVIPGSSGRAADDASRSLIRNVLPAPETGKSGTGAIASDQAKKLIQDIGQPNEFSPVPRKRKEEFTRAILKTFTGNDNGVKRLDNLTVSETHEYYRIVESSVKALTQMMATVGKADLRLIEDVVVREILIGMDMSDKDIAIDVLTRIGKTSLRQKELTPFKEASLGAKGKAKALIREGGASTLKEIIPASRAKFSKQGKEVTPAKEAIKGRVSKGGVDVSRKVRREVEKVTRQLSETEAIQAFDAAKSGDNFPAFINPLHRMFADEVRLFVREGLAEAKKVDLVEGNLGTLNSAISKRLRSIFESSEVPRVNSQVANDAKVQNLQEAARVLDEHGYKDLADMYEADARLLQGELGISERVSSLYVDDADLSSFWTMRPEKLGNPNTKNARQVNVAAYSEPTTKAISRAIDSTTPTAGGEVSTVDINGALDELNEAITLNKGDIREEGALLAQVQKTKDRLLSNSTLTADSAEVIGLSKKADNIIKRSVSRLTASRDSREFEVLAGDPSIQSLVRTMGTEKAPVLGTSFNAKRAKQLELRISGRTTDRVNALNKAETKLSRAKKSGEGIADAQSDLNFIKKDISQATGRAVKLKESFVKLKALNDTLNLHSLHVEFIRATDNGDIDRVTQILTDAQTLRTRGAVQHPLGDDVPVNGTIARGGVPAESNLSRSLKLKIKSLEFELTEPTGQVFRKGKKTDKSVVMSELDRTKKELSVENAKLLKTKDDLPLPGGSDTGENILTQTGHADHAGDAGLRASATTDEVENVLINRTHKPQPVKESLDRVRQLFKDEDVRGRIFRKAIFNFDDVTHGMWSVLARNIPGFSTDVIQTTKIGTFLPDANPMVLNRLLYGHADYMDASLMTGFVDPLDPTLNVMVKDFGDGFFVNALRREDELLDGEEALSVTWATKVLDHSNQKVFDDEMTDALVYMLHKNKTDRGELFGGSEELLRELDSQHAKVIGGDQARLSRIQEFAKRYSHLMDYPLEYALAKGMITPNDFKNIKAKNQFYVNTERDMSLAEKDLIYSKGADGEVDAGQVFKHFKGSRRKINNLMATTFNQMREVMYQSDLNDYRKSLFTMIENANGDDIARRLNIKDVISDKGVRSAVADVKPIDDTLLGKARERAVKANLQAETDMNLLTGRESGDIEVVRVNGERRWYQINDPEFKQSYDQAFESSTLANLQGMSIVKFLSKDVVQKFVTMSPSFIIRNIPRDFLFQFLANPFDVSLKEFSTQTLNVARDAVLKTENGKRALRQFKIGGAGQATKATYMNDPKTWHRVSRDLMREMQGDPSIKNVIFANPDGVGGAFRGVMDQWERIAAGSEQIGRQRQFNIAYEYAHNLRAGGTGLSEKNKLLFSAFQARDIMDYAVAGRWIKELAPFIPFLNAGIRGTSRTIRAMKDVVQNKEGAAGRFGSRFLTTMIVPEAMAYMFNKAIGAEKEWEEMPAHTKDMFWSFKMFDNTWLRIPKPFEYGVMASMVGRGLNTASNVIDGVPFVEAYDRAFDGWGGSAFDAGVPADEGLFLGPFRVMVELMTNRDLFRGRYIVSPYEEGQDIRLRSGAKTASTFGQWTAPVLDTISPWTVDPRQVDFVVKRMFGGIGKVGLTATDLLNRDKAVSTTRAMDSVLGILNETPSAFGTSATRSRELGTKLGLLRSNKFQEQRKLTRRLFSPGVSAKEKEEISRRIAEVSREIEEELSRPEVFEKALRRKQKRDRDFNK